MAKILVVDDEASLRNLIQRILVTEGHQVFQADTGALALSVVETEPLDLVLLDFRLAGENGLEILMKLKTQRPELPVIMVTGYDRADSAVDLLKAGARDYLTKPFDNARLLEVVRQGLVPQPLPLLSTAPNLVVEKKNVPISRGMRRWVAAAMMAGVIGIGGWVVWRGRSLPAVGESVVTPIPGTHVAALAVDQPARVLWMSDWYAQKIYLAALSPKVDVVDTILLTDRHFTGLAVTGEEVFGCDPLVKKIYRYRRFPSWKEITNLASPGPSPSGLCWDGRDMWSVDRQTARLYRHQGDAVLTVKGVWNAPGPSPIGLAWEADRLWVVDGKTETLYEMTVTSDRGPVTIARYRLPSRPGRLAGFTMEGDRVWTVCEGYPLLFMDELGGLKKEVGPQISTSPAPRAGGR